MAGQSLWHPRGFGVCLTLALVYAAGFFILGWILTGEGRIGEMVITESGLVRRLGLAVGLVAVVILGLRSRRIDGWAKDKLQRAGLSERWATRGYGWGGGVAVALGWLGVVLVLRGPEGLSWMDLAVPCFLFGFLWIL